MTQRSHRFNVLDDDSAYVVFAFLAVLCALSEVLGRSMEVACE